MKLFITILIAIYTTVSAFASNVEFTKQEKEFIKNAPAIKIGSMNTYTPFSFMKNGKKVGFTQDLLKIISQKSGLKFDVVGGAWPEIYTLFKEAKIDMISEFSHRKERLPFTIFSAPYYEIPIGVFTRSDFDAYTGIESLRNKKVGVVKKSYIIDILLEENINIVEFDNADDRFLALKNRQIDVVITNAMNIYKLEKMMLPNIKLAGRFVHPDTKNEDLRFGTRIEKPLLASIINKTLNSIPFSSITKLKQDWILNLNKPNVQLSYKEQNWVKNNTVVIGIEPAKPYIFYDEKKNHNSGLYFDILKNVITATNLEVQYVYDDWAGLLNKFKAGEIDLLPATFYSKEREKFGLFSEEYYKVREYIYVSSQNRTIHGLKDLEGKKVAISKDYSTIQKIKQAFPKIQIIETKGLDESTSKVLNGEVDALIDYHLVVENYIRDNSIVGLKDIAQDDLNSVSVHFLSNKQKPLLQSVLQKGLNDISREEMNNILQKWVRTPYNQKQNLLSKEEEEFIIKHQKIRFAVTSKRPPFEFVENNKPVGIAVDYIKKSAKNVGLDIEFVVSEMSNQDAYDVIENRRDKFDTILLSVKSEQREKRFSYGESYLSYPVMIVTYQNAPYIGSMKDLSNKTIALEEGYLLHDWIKKDYPSIKILNVKNTQEALQYVNDEKVDAYIGNLAVANYMMLFGDMKNLKLAAPSGYGNLEYHFIAPKEWPELATILSKGFEQITPSEHSAIQQKWFALQTIEKVDYSLIWKIVFVGVLVIAWILWWNRKLTLEKKRTQKALKLLQNATSKLEEKNIEVQESKNFLESVLDESPDPIIIKNQNGKFLLVNKALANLYNSTPALMIGKCDEDFPHLKKISDFFNKDVQKIIESGKTVVVSENFKDTHNSEIRYFITTKKPFFNEKGEKLILIIANDITTIKKLEEEQLEQQQLLLNQSKIAAMGEMLGNISHQWRQPLSVITSQASALKVWVEFGHELTHDKLFNCSDSIIKQANYLSKTIDDFRNFFISDSTNKQVYNLKSVFMKLEDLIKIPYENNFIEIINHFEDNIEVELNENILIQALINIYNNTKDAFLEKEIPTADRYMFVTMRKNEKSAQIIFVDSASGIQEDSIDKIFEPYFTTKHQSVGTGIGLYMTNQIVTKHLKGSIEAKNESYTYNDKKYTGAKFIITLPLK